MVKINYNSAVFISIKTLLPFMKKMLIALVVRYVVIGFIN